MFVYDMDFEITFNNHICVCVLCLVCFTVFMFAEILNRQAFFIDRPLGMNGKKYRRPSLKCLRKHTAKVGAQFQ